MLGECFEIELTQRLAIGDLKRQKGRRLASRFWQFHDAKVERFVVELKRQGFRKDAEDSSHWANTVGWLYLGEKLFEIEQGKQEVCVFILSATVHNIQKRGLSGLLLSASLHRALDAANLIGASAPKAFNPEINNVEASYDISKTNLPDTTQLTAYYERLGWHVHPLLKTEKGRDIMVRIPEKYRWNPHTDWDLEKQEPPKRLIVDDNGPQGKRLDIVWRCYSGKF